MSRTVYVTIRVELPDETPNNYVAAYVLAATRTANKAAINTIAKSGRIDERSIQIHDIFNDLNIRKKPGVSGNPFA